MTIELDRYYASLKQINDSKRMQSESFPTVGRTEEEVMNSLAYEDKLKKFVAGDYSFPVPPIPTIQWDTPDWINYIDLKGKWL